MIDVHCPQCRMAIRARNEMAGQRVKCPGCGAAMSIPGAVAAKRPSLTPLGSGASASSTDVSPAGRPSKPISNPQAVPSSKTSSRTAPTAPPPRTAPAAPPARAPLPIPEFAPAPGTQASFTNVAPLAPPLPPAAPLRNVGLPSPSLTSAPPASPVRVSRQGLPTWVFFAGGAAVLVAIAVGVLALNRSRVHSEAAALEARAAAQKADEERRRVIDERSRRESSKLNMRPLSAGFEGRREIPKPGPGAAKEEVVNYVEYAIVKIQCYDWYNEVGSEGTGFVVAMDNGSALVATNYHVMRNAFRKADVLFNKGERYGVEGYVGVDPACDLAIVRLNGMPVNTQVLSLVRQTPSARDHVYAIGHPLGYEFQTTSGDIGQVLLTNELSADSQKFVRASLGNSVNHRWLAHDAPISPGNSGGPLLNAQGEVLGVNTWVDQQRKLGYALGVSHLERLLEQRFDEVVPLNRYFRPPVEMIVEDEGDQPEEELELNILHPDDFSTALKILGTVNFRPTNEGEFELLRDLSATMALVPRGRTSRQREALASALAGVNWDLASHAKVLNERAVAGFGKPQGIAFLGTVEKAVQQGAVLRVFFDLDGTNRRAYVPLSSEFGEVRAGAKWLVLGFCEVRELVTEEDGKQHAATTFRCQYMFPLPK